MVFFYLDELLEDWCNILTSFFIQNWTLKNEILRDS